MAGYTSDEIEASVSRFVKAEISDERDELGPDKQDVKFSEVIELISSTLIFDPNAIFYVIFLATNRLNKNVEQSIAYVEDVLDAITEMSHRTTEITRTSLLGDAAAALLEVDTILTERDAVSNNAFNRYLSSLNSFITVSLRPNIKSGTDIIRPPQQARVEARTSLSSLATSYADHLEVISQISQMLTEFNAINLPVLAIQNSVRQARADLEDLQTTFESALTTRDAKIAESRDAYLRLVSGKAVLTNYNTVTDPSSPRMSSSSALKGRAALPLGDGEYVVAETVCTKSAPWAIETGVNDELKIAEDGNPETTYTLVPPTQPQLDSALDEDWDSGGTNTAYDIVVGVNDKLEIDGLAPRVTLTSGGNRTAVQIASDITSWATTNSYPYSASALNLGGLNYVRIVKTSYGAQRLRMTALDAGDRAAILAAYTTLGFYEGQEDTAGGVTATELAEQINAADKVLASVERTTFEEGDDGTITSLTELQLPAGTIVSDVGQDDMLVIRNGESVGYHRLAIDPVADQITVVADQPFVQLESNVEYLLVREVVRVKSISSGLTGKLAINASSAVSTLGFTVGETDSTTTGFRAAESGNDKDFVQADIVEGDILRITAGATEHEITEISNGGQQLEVDPPIDVDRTNLAFSIYSAAAVAYENFSLALSAWDAARESSSFVEDTLELDRVMNPLLANKRPSAAQTNDATTVAMELLSLLSSLSAVLTDFEVSSVGRVDAALKMLQERGMDRAYDTLLDGKITEFFEYDKDDASNSSYMLKAMRQVVVADLPLSKLEEDADDIIHDELIIGTDADLDFTDVDGEDENVLPLGEIPDLNEQDEGTLRQRL